MKYTESHEWIKVDDVGVATVGVTDFAQRELGDIVYVELPKVGKEVNIGGEVAVLESTKAAADVYSPVSGVIVDVNVELQSASELVNRDPEKEGWIFRIKLTNPNELNHLMDREAYRKKFH